MKKRQVAPTVATDNEGIPKRLIWISIASCLISVQYGYNMWVLYSPFVLLHDLFNITTFEEMEDPNSQMVLVIITIALYPLGALFGVLPVGFLANRFGRRGTVKITTMLCLLSPALLACGEQINVHEYTIAARFYTGLCTGLVSVIVPLYLGEISPGSLRGAIVSMSQLFYATGVLLGQLFVFREIFEMPGGYIVLMGISGVMPFLEIILLRFLPESPRYLFIQRKDEETAREVLKILRGKEDVEDEMEELHQEDVAEKAEKYMTALNLLSYPNLRWQVITIVVLTSGAQLDGISALHFYSDIIYASAGADESMIRYLHILAIGIGCISTLIAMYLTDSMGHRYMLLIGFGICSIICILLTMALEMQSSIEEMSYVSVLLVELFVIAHAIGPGPLPNVIVVLMFLQSSRSSAFVISGFVHWITHFLITMMLIPVVAKVGNYSFLAFFLMSGGLFIYLFKNYPETKNRTFVDIRRMMAIHRVKKTKHKKQRKK